MSLIKKTYQVSGMHCSACEVFIEREFRILPGVEKVKANSAGWVSVWCQQEPDINIINQRIADHGYQIKTTSTPVAFNWYRLGGLVLVITAIYVLFRRFNLAPNISAGQDLSLIVVFVMGLVAAVSSCMAVTGGLLVAISVNYSKKHASSNSWQRFRPHIFFNIGRLVSYAVLGAVVGALGSALTLSSRANGFVTLLASLAMIILGLKLLNIFPWFSHLSIRPPKLIYHKLHDAAGNPKAWAPFFLGAATFFLPCGFTQALQLYVLTIGKPMLGGIIMFVFALGTLPALVGLGLITSWFKVRQQAFIATIAGVLVVALGLVNLGYGLNLAGLNIVLASARDNFKIATSRQGVTITDPNVFWDGRTQVVKMDVVARGYSPNRFTVQAGLPVRWEINGVNTYGCQSLLQLPAYNINTFIKPGLNVIEFTPQRSGQLIFHCSMGMYTGSFTVLPSSDHLEPVNLPPKTCNPKITNCI